MAHVPYNQDMVKTVSQPSKSKLTQITKILWGLAIFSFPFNVSILLWQTTILEQGSFNPYTSFSLYVSEILIFATLVGWFIERLIKGSFKLKKTTVKLSVVIMGLAIVSLIFSQNLISSTLHLIHIASFLSIILLFGQEVLPNKRIKEIFIATVALQSIIAVLQVINQGALGLQFLGESQVTVETPGIAKQTFGDLTLLRGYGTLPHANILAGYTVVAYYFITQLDWAKFKGKGKAIRFLGIDLIIAGLIASYSEAAILALLVGIIILRGFKKRYFQIAVLMLATVSILLVGLNWNELIKNESIHERIEYMKIGSEMIIKAPQGVGLQQFTDRMQDFYEEKLQPWQFQPVHNIYLLVANEWGIWTLFLLIFGITKFSKKHRKEKLKIAFLFTLFIIGLFDHYLISLYQGLTLTAITTGSLLYSPRTEPKKSG
ncbi:MAG: O-antigen ligase family protein [Candidatus Peregrinibacteria bacterium]|nr:O-antigen ligase family protein [Candidatus Peregrinibacteria bacterium]